jgi:hypothetical protein
MPIIVSEGGRNARRIEPSGFDLEDHLQEYIFRNPEVIPLDDIEAGTRLFIAAREFPTPSGPIDALAFDASGNIFVVETKLYRNPDKRTVVAQALDYGASLWRHTAAFADFLALLGRSCNAKFGIPFREKYAEFFTLDDATDSISAIESNLSEGRIKFVVLMDKVHPALLALIVFVNQNSKFDLYGVELEYYRHDSFEIVIPKLFGGEVKKDLESKARKRGPQIEFLNAVLAEVQRRGLFGRSPQDPRASSGRCIWAPLPPGHPSAGSSTSIDKCSRAICALPRSRIEIPEPTDGDKSLADRSGLPHCCSGSTRTSAPVLHATGQATSGAAARYGLAEVTEQHCLLFKGCSRGLYLRFQSHSTLPQAVRQGPEHLNVGSDKFPSTDANSKWAQWESNPQPAD